jgi:hypothetical protein
MESSLGSKIIIKNSLGYLNNSRYKKPNIGNEIYLHYQCQKVFINKKDECQLALFTYIARGIHPNQYSKIITFLSYY